MTATSGEELGHQLTPARLAHVAFTIVAVVWLATALPQFLAGVMGLMTDKAFEADYARMAWLTTLSNLAIAVALLFGSRWMADRMFRGMDAPVIAVSPYDVMNAALLVVGLVMFLTGLSTVLTGRSPMTHFHLVSNASHRWYGVLWIAIGCALALNPNMLVRAWRARTIRRLSKRAGDRS